MKASTTAGTATLGLPQCSPGRQSPTLAKKSADTPAHMAKVKPGICTCPTPLKARCTPTARRTTGAGSRIAGTSATAAQTQTYPEYSGHTDEIFANLATGKFRVIQSVDGYTVSTDPDLIKVCNSAHKMSAEELAKELAFAVKIHCEYENG